MRSPLLLLAALLLCAPGVRADGGDGVDDPVAPAGKNCMEGIQAPPGTFCENVRDCRKFCACACDIDYTKWEPNVKNDGSTQCPRAPRNGPGMIPSDSPDLSYLPDFKYITHRAKERVAPTALEGLKRLETYLESSPEREKYGFKVRVVSCYREQLEDTEPECGFVLKSLHMLGKPGVDKAYWEKTSDPNNLGLTWPGRTPHSGGYACDLVLVDKRGRDSFGVSAGVGDSPTSSINQRLASKMLDAAVTDPTVGASRLTFEAWHYEWGSDTTGSRCKAPDCNDRYWPVKGTP